MRNASLAERRTGIAARQPITHSPFREGSHGACRLLRFQFCRYNDPIDRLSAASAARRRWRRPPSRALRRQARGSRRTTWRTPRGSTGILLRVFAAKLLAYSSISPPLRPRCLMIVQRLQQRTLRGAAGGSCAPGAALQATPCHAAAACRCSSARRRAARSRWAAQQPAREPRRPAEDACATEAGCVCARAPRLQPLLRPLCTAAAAPAQRRAAAGQMLLGARPWLSLPQR